MTARKPSIYWLEEFGLSLDQLTSLESLKVRLTVHFLYVDEEALFKFKPSDRRKKIKQHYETLLARFKKKWSQSPIKISWVRRQPRGFTTWVEAKQVAMLRKIPGIDSIWLDEIPGRKRKSVKKTTERWFAVQARFALQVEGQATGLQSYEDRIVIVKALSPEAAKEKLKPEFRDYGTPYLNTHGFMVRWKFEQVLDIYEIGDEEMNPQGVEVFSVRKQRRIKPEHARKTHSPKHIHKK